MWNFLKYLQVPARYGVQFIGRDTIRGECWWLAAVDNGADDAGEWWLDALDIGVDDPMDKTASLTQRTNNAYRVQVSEPGKVSANKNMPTKHEMSVICCGNIDTQQGTVHKNGGAQTKGTRSPVGRREKMHKKWNLEAEWNVGMVGKISFISKVSRDLGATDIVGLGCANHPPPALH